MDLTIETNMNAPIEIKDFAGRVLYTHQPADSSGMTRTKRQAPGFSPGSSVQAGTACCCSMY